jgi:hypothetical protein
MSGATCKMDEFQRHVLKRLGDVENELRELREVAWPVCQARLDNRNPLNNLKQKRKILRWLDMEEIRDLLRRKGLLMGLTRDQVAVELREVLVEAPHSAS